jgi:hypothetical protein
MSVVGIVILITLLLILKLIAQATSEPLTTALSAHELQEQIYSLQPVLTKIQSEISQQHQTKLETIITPQTRNQIDALLAINKRLEAECIELDKEIQEEKNHTEILKKDLKLKLLPDNESRIKEMTEQLKRLKIESEALSEQAKVLETSYEELALKKQELETTAATVVPHQLSITVQKRPNSTVFICVYGEKDGLTVIPTNGAAQKTFTSNSDFYNWLESRNSATDHFVIYFRPSRFSKYKELLSRMKSKGFTIGYQVIGETTNVISFGMTN